MIENNEIEKKNKRNFLIFYNALCFALADTKFRLTGAPILLHSDSLWIIYNLWAVDGA